MNEAKNTQGSEGKMKAEQMLLSVYPEDKERLEEIRIELGIKSTSATVRHLIHGWSNGTTDGNEAEEQKS